MNSCYGGQGDAEPIRGRKLPNRSRDTADSDASDGLQASDVLYGRRLAEGPVRAGGTLSARRGEPERQLLTLRIVPRPTRLRRRPAARHDAEPSAASAVRDHWCRNLKGGCKLRRPARPASAPQGARRSGLLFQRPAIIGAATDPRLAKSAPAATATRVRVVLLGRPHCPAGRRPRWHGRGGRDGR